MADEQPGATIEDYLIEDRTFPPPEDFKERSLVASPFLYDEANEDWQGFWARQAADLLDWDEEWHTILEWDLPFAKWFVGGKLNVAYNCLDRHVEAGHGDQVAFYWEGEPGDSRAVTYTELLEQTCRVANALRFGCVWVNDHIPLAAEMPHGGYKQSGYGKDLSIYSLEDYTQIKHVMVSLS